MNTRNTTHPAPLDAGYAPGDIVQIVDEADPWFGCLLVVTEPKPWGVQGFVSVPGLNEPPGAMYRRPRNEQIVRVGRVALALGEA